MGIFTEDLDNIDGSVIADIEKFVATYLADRYPELDLTESSALYQTVVRTAATIQGLTLQDGINLLNSNSIQAVITDPNLADEETVSALLSNYFITRNQGQPATGFVRVFINEFRQTQITPSNTFTANNVLFSPTRRYRGVKSADDVVSPTDIVLTPRGALWYFDVPVVAEVNGEAGNIVAGTSLTNNVSGNQVTSTIARDDFTGGQDTETNEDLVDRATSGIGGKNLGSRPAVRSLIEENFPQVRDVSVISGLDSENIRAGYNPFKIFGTGKADVFVRTREYPLITTIRKSATLTDAVNGTWSVSLSRDEASGCYELVSATSVSDGGVATKRSLIRSVDVTPVSGVDQNPEIQSDAVAFTRYQTLDLTFDLVAPGESEGATRDFELKLLQMPDISTISDLLTSRNFRFPSSDTLIRATIPCLVSVGIQVIKGPGDIEPEIEPIQLAIADAVNSIDFAAGILSVDTIIDVTRNFLPKRSRIKQPVDLRGRIITPDTSVNYLDPTNDGSEFIFDPRELLINSSGMVSSRTTSYMCDPSAVNIEFIENDRPLV